MIRLIEDVSARFLVLDAHGHPHKAVDAIFLVAVVAGFGKRRVFEGGFDAVFFVAVVAWRGWGFWGKVIREELKVNWRLIHNEVLSMQHLHRFVPM